MIYRQGDIIIKGIEKLPENLSLVGLVSNEIGFVLREGKYTGHKHLLVADRGTMEIMKDKNGKFYLKFSNFVDLVHEDHKTITIFPGTYEVSNEREFDYFLNEARRVVD